MDGIRQISAFAVVLFFVVFFFSCGIREQTSPTYIVLGDSEFPDFSKYAPLRTLSSEEFPIDHPNKRVIVIGDVHGMDRSLHSILSKLSFDPHIDTLIHAGDIIAKGSHKGSLAVLSFMTAHNVTGVRGNHDQKVIEWRAWMDWIRTLPGGELFLDRLGDDKETGSGEPEEDSEDWPWWGKIPDGWKVYSDHYRLARDLSEAHYEYLLSLPLVIHIPHAHAFVAHAGILSSDPHYAPDHIRQPLARLPEVHLPGAMGDKTREMVLRLAQEEAVLREVPQNGVPFNVLNMRGVLRDHRVTRKKKGTPWSELWNADISRCLGYSTSTIPASEHTSDSDTEKNGDLTPLPCLPSTIIYGHAASRGLDIKRWSIGLDTGCVYRRRLSALVLGSSSHHLDDIEEVDASKKSNSLVEFGDYGQGRIVSIRCH